MAIYYPPILINAYLQDKIGNDPRFGYTIPFFPVSPTAIEDLTATFPDAANNVFAVYDRMLKMRRSPFPHIKSEQTLYYFYKTAGDPEQLIETTQIVQDLLDREDESAQDLNDWIREYQAANPGDPVDGQPTVRILGKDFFLPYFHKTKIYQLEETRDIVDFGTARTYAGNKIIIDYDWHKSE